MSESVAYRLGGTGRQPGPVRRLIASLSRHDFVLAVIPSAFLVAMLVGTLLGLSTETVLFGGATIGIAALLDALFLNPPLDGESASP